MISVSRYFKQILSTIPLGTVFNVILQNFLCNCSGLFKNVGLSEFATFILRNDTLKTK